MTVDTSFDIEPIGGFPFAGALVVSPDGRSLAGCLDSSYRFDGDLADLQFSDTTFTACLAADPLTGLSLTQRLAGRVALETGATPVAFTGRYLDGAGLPGVPVHWRIELDVPGLDLGNVPLDFARLVIEQRLSTVNLTRALELGLTIGQGASALLLEGRGPWTPDGALDLPLALPPGVVWEPAPELVFADVDAHYRRSAGIWTLTIGVDTTVNLGPFGLTAVAGDFTIAADGHSVTGCLTGPGPAVTTLGGFELRQLAARLCLEDTTFGPVLLPGLSGELSLPVDPIWYPVAIVLSPGADWSAEMTVADLALGDYNLDQATFRVSHFGPPANEDALSLEATKTLGAGPPGSIDLRFSGAWSHTGEVVLGVDTEPTATWTPDLAGPAADLVFSAIAGQLGRVDAEWRLDLLVTTALQLDPFGLVELNGSLLVDDAGLTFEGCLGAVTAAETPLVVDAVSFEDARPGACFGTADGADPDARTYPLATYVNGSADVALGPHHPPADPTTPATLDWRFAVELAPFSLGTWEARGRDIPLGLPYFDGESWYFGQEDYRALGQGPLLGVQRTTSGQVAPTLATRIIAHEGVDDLDLVLDVDGPWAGDTRNLTLPATQVADTNWAPSPLAPGLVFDSVTGVVKRDAGIWSFAVNGTAAVDLAPLGPMTLQGDVTWSFGAGLVGAAEAPVALTTLAGFPIRNTVLKASFTVPSRLMITLPLPFGNRPPPPVDTLVYTLTGEISWGAGYLPFTATYTPASDPTTPDAWSITLRVQNLRLGTFTLPVATLTIAPDATGEVAVDVSAKLVTTLYDLDVSGAWSHPADMVWTASGKVIGQGAVAAVGAQVGGSFRRTAGTWSLDMSALTPVDLGPFGTINFDGATKAEAEASPTGIACDTFTRATTSTLTAQPVVGGITFDNISFEACYDEATATWTYNLAATVTLNGQQRQITATLTRPTAANTIKVVGTLTNLVLGSGFSIPTVTLTFDWTRNTLDRARIQGRMVLFGNPGAASALHLDVDSTWPKTGPFTLDVAMPEDLPWQPNGDLTATVITGRIEKAGSTWSIRLASTFQAYLGAQLGAHDITGTFTIQSGGVFSACLETATGAAFNLQLGGVSLKQLRLSACIARSQAGAPLSVTVELGGKVDMRGADFDFSATYATLPTGGWELVASVDNLVLGSFSLPHASLTFKNGGRLVEVFLKADLTLGDLQLQLNGEWHAAGDFNIALGMKATPSGSSARWTSRARAASSRSAARPGPSTSASAPTSASAQ